MENAYKKLLKMISQNPARVGVIFLVIFALLGYASFDDYRLRGRTAELALKIEELDKNLRHTEDLLASARRENDDLNIQLGTEKNKNFSFEKQIGEITESVGTLVKLSKTDKELLQKYSKVYFLNENYIPSNLTAIDQKYLYNGDKLEQIHTNVLPFLTRFIDDAATQGIKLKIISAYRSFGTQASLKSGYNVTFGAGTANKFSAEQGFSEHQLGTTVDFTSEKLGAAFENFEKDPAYKWLTENAYKYGFILSYPKDNLYYLFEPWHWRFVGKSLAEKLHTEGKNFYALEQRVIDDFLVSIFDQ